MSQDTLIKIKRGPESSLPVLNDGELTYTKDQKNLYIGTPDGNKKVIDKEEIQSKISYKIINNAVDLNTLTKTGFYTLNFAEAPNKPTAYSGTLFVNFDVTTPYQTFEPDAAPTFTEYRRFLLEDKVTWSDWLGASEGFEDTEDGINGPASEYFSQFQIGDDIDLLKWAVDETSEIIDFLEGNIDYMLASSTIKVDVLQTGLFYELLSEYSHYHIGFATTSVNNGVRVTNLMASEIAKEDDWISEVTIPYNESYDESWFIVLSEIPLEDINEETINKIKAFGVNIVFNDESSEERKEVYRTMRTYRFDDLEYVEETNEYYGHLYVTHRDFEYYRNRLIPINGEVLVGETVIELENFSGGKVTFYAILEEGSSGNTFQSVSSSYVYPPGSHFIPVRYSFKKDVLNDDGDFAFYLIEGSVSLEGTADRVSFKNGSLSGIVKGLGGYTE